MAKVNLRIRWPTQSFTSISPDYTHDACCESKLLFLTVRIKCMMNQHRIILSAVALFFLSITLSAQQFHKRLSPPDKEHSRRLVHRRDENGSYASYSEGGVCKDYRRTLVCTGQSRTKVSGHGCGGSPWFAPPTPHFRGSTGQRMVCSLRARRLCAQLLRAAVQS